MPEASANDDLRIFLSYSRKDSRQAHALAQELKDAGFDIWIDVEGIKPTQEWMHELGDAILDSHVFIFLESAQYAQSTMCMFELKTAIENNCRLLQIVHEDSRSDELQSLISDVSLTSISNSINGSEVSARLRQLIASEGVGLKRVRDLIRRAKEWEVAKENEDLLWAGDQLSQGEVSLNRLSEASSKVNSAVSRFISESRNRENSQRSATRRRRILRTACYCFVFIFSLFLFGMSYDLRDKAKVSRDEAEMEKAKAEELVEYILMDIADVYRNHGRFSGLSDSVGRLSNYFEKVDPYNASREDLLYYSRMGHLLVEVYLNQGECTDAINTAERTLRFDEIAMEQFPDDVDVSWNFAFSHFWNGASKGECGDMLESEDGLRAFYEITKEHQSLSANWKYEYINSVFNLMIIEVYKENDLALENLEQEIYAYYSSKQNPSLEDDALYIDTLYWINYYDVMSAKYDAVLLRMEGFDFKYVPGNYYYNRALGTNKLLLGDAQLYSKRFSVAEREYEIAQTIFEKITAEDPTNNLENMHTLGSIHGLWMAEQFLSTWNPGFVPNLESVFSDNQLRDSSSGVEFERLVALTESFHKALYHGKVNVDDFEAVMDLMELAEEYADHLLTKAILSEFFFLAAYFSNISQEAELAREILGHIERVADVHQPKKKMARCLTIYVRACEILEVTEPEYYQVKHFLDEADCYDPYVSVLESLFHDRAKD